MSQDSPPTLDLRLAHRFEGGFALEVALTARAQTIALFGPSGSGKTSVLRAIAGLLRPREGHVRLAGKTLFDRAGGLELPPRQRRVGLVVQDGLLFPRLSVRENLGFGAPLSPRLALEEVAGVLEVEDLLDRRPRDLSGGERQRIALGRAVLSEPDVLLCDEPFAALDAPLRRRLVPVLARLRSLLGVPLVLVSHEVSEVLALASEVAVLEAGRVVAHGPTPSLLSILAEDDASALNFWDGVAGSCDGDLLAVEVGAHVLHVPKPGVGAGARVRLTVAPCHVALGLPGATSPASPRNRLEGTVVAVDPFQGLIRVTLRVDPDLSVTSLVTPAAAQELGLIAGTKAIARIKATALQVLSTS